MAWVAGDWTITRSTGNIRYIGDDHGGASPSYVTVIELRRELGKLADDAAASGDDEYDITDPTAADRKTDNYIQLLGNYNIDATAAEHIYDGSIVQGTGGTEEFFDGIVNYGNADVQIQLIQDGAVLTDDWWNFGGAGLNADATQGISHRFMIKTRTAGADIDGRRLVGTCRRFNKTYSEFSINGTSRGNNVLALTDATDLNNGTAEATVATWDKFSNLSEGYTALDIDNDAVNEYYYSEWDIGAGTLPASPTINDLYEWTKHETRDGSASTLYGLSGELFRGITHEVAITPGSGTWVEPESLSWGSGATAGTGQLLAVDDTTGTATSKMWIQLLTGVVPNANLITGNGGATGTAGTVTSRTLSYPFFGVSTGTAMIGAYGLGVNPNDLTQNDKVFDLTNTQRTPPNNVTFSVLGLTSGEDYVLVTNDNGSDIDYAQFTLNGALTGGETTVTVNGSIDTDTPSSGSIRIFDGTGYTKVTYTGYSGSDFTGCSGTPAASNGANTFISYIDKLAASSTESFTGVYLADRTLFIRVRDGGATPIKTFETTGTLGINGGSATAIRTSDL